MTYTTVQHRERDGTAQQVPCPPSVVVYDKFMVGVDKADKLRKYYRVRCKTWKFYCYVFWFLFDSCIVNAFVLIQACYRSYPPASNFQELLNSSCPWSQWRLQLPPTIRNSCCHQGCFSKCPTTSKTPNTTTRNASNNPRSSACISANPGPYTSFVVSICLVYVYKYHYLLCKGYVYV